jgi:hypothetical protein
MNPKVIKSALFDKRDQLISLKIKGDKSNGSKNTPSIAEYERI